MKNIFDLDIMNKADDLYHQQSAYAVLKQKTIPSNRIQILEKMASGQFGIVYKGWSIFTSSKIENEWKNRQAPLNLPGPPVHSHYLDLDLNGLLTRRNFCCIPGMLEKLYDPKLKRIFEIAASRF